MAFVRLLITWVKIKKNRDKKKSLKENPPSLSRTKISEVKEWGEVIRHLSLIQFSAIDECHFYLHLAPRIGYSPKGQRAISPAPGSKGGSIHWLFGKSKNSKGIV